MNSIPYQSALGTPSRRDLELQSQIRHLQQESLQLHMPEYVHKLLLPIMGQGGTLFCSASILFSKNSKSQPLAEGPKAPLACSCRTLWPNVSQQHQHGAALQLTCSPKPQQQAACKPHLQPSLSQSMQCIMAQVQPCAAAAELACAPVAPSVQLAAEPTCSLVSISSMQLLPAHRRPSARLMSMSASRSLIRCSKRCCSQAVDWMRTKLQARGGCFSCLYTAHSERGRHTMLQAH